MKPLIPSETALVLGGGGAKGSYEVGAIAALRELGIEAGSVYGVSIGALNAAMYAQGDMEKAEALWQSVRLSDLLSPESLALADDAEAIYDHPEKALEFITRNAQNRGMDVTPLRQVIETYVDEAAVRRSTVRMGLVATRFPSLSMVEKRIEDMEEGSLHDWLMASSACYPAFPMASVGGERYVDGGFCDNAPVEMAVRSGARHIIALDIGRNPSHTQYRMRPNITYIRTSQPLGGLLTFSPEQAARNRIIGYNDVMRAFGQLRGTRYAFDSLDAQTLYARAEDFIIHLTQVETGLQRANAITRRDNAAPLFSLLEEGLRPGADAIDYFLRACELCGEIAQVNPAQVFTFSTFTDELRARLPLEKAESMVGSLLGGRIGVLFSAPQPDRKLIIACLYHLLQRENTFSALAMHTLSAFPRELLCAMTLRNIL